MFIKQLHLQNFKRFTDLTIDLSTEKIAPKLVLLIWANGCGKSSIFDSFEYLSRVSVRWHAVLDDVYYKKDQNLDFQIEIEFTDGQSFLKTDRNLLKDDVLKKFYGRSSLRIVPEITWNTNISSLQNNTDGPEKYIKFDTRFENDYEQFINNIFNELAKPVFQWKNADTIQIFQELINPINMSLQNIFWNDLSLSIQIERFTPSNRNTPAQLYFRKGWSVVSYNLLSHGEKQIIILLLNFAVRKDLMPDYIYYIDEMDVHLNTALQYSVLEEIVHNRLPIWSQLWTATHALWFIEFAKNDDRSCIVDFDHFDFDETKLLIPIDKNDPEKTYYNIALTPWIIDLFVRSDTVSVVFSEWNNKILLQKAFSFYNIKERIDFQNGSGKNQLKTLFDILSQNKFSRYKIYFVFDNDANEEYKSCLKNKTEFLIPILLTNNNTNILVKKWVENMFPQYLFEKNYSDRNKYYKINSVTSDYWELVNNEKFDKKLFMDYIISKNDKTDFCNFEKIIKQVIID